MSRSADDYRFAAPNGFPDAWGIPRNWSLDGASPFEAMRVLDPKPHAGRIKRLLSDFQALFPQLGPVGLQASWAGMIDVMPDVVPIVDRAPDLPGLWIGTGMSGHGFGIGPGFGRILADLMSGGQAGHDMARFRFSPLYRRIKAGDGAGNVICTGFFTGLFTGLAGSGALRQVARNALARGYPHARQEPFCRTA